MLFTYVVRYVYAILVLAIATPFYALYALIVDYKKFYNIREMWKEIIHFSNWR